MPPVPLLTETAPARVTDLIVAVPFAPLGAAQIRRIADREWHKVLARDGLRFRDLALNAAPQLLDHLAATGYDPR